MYHKQCIKYHRPTSSKSIPAVCLYQESTLVCSMDQTGSPCMHSAAIIKLVLYTLCSMHQDDSNEHSTSQSSSYRVSLCSLHASSWLYRFYSMHQLEAGYIHSSTCSIVSSRLYTLCSMQQAGSVLN